MKVMGLGGLRVRNSLDEGDRVRGLGVKKSVG